MDVDQKEEQDLSNDLSNSDVVEKYKKAAQIANGAIALVAQNCVPGKSVIELCDIGDKYINEETGKIYNKVGKDKKKIEKGIGFPTCISINHIVGNFSPLSGNKTVIAEGDLVKVDLGVQIDGYVTVGAHSFVVPKAGDATVSGKHANVLMAAHTAAEAALRLLKPGNTNNQVTDMIAKVAKTYNVNAVQGVLSHELSRFIIDGEKVILNKADPEQKVEVCEFAPNQVWAIDIVMSTGEGKPRELDERTTVYKRAMDMGYNLKSKTSREIFGEIQKTASAFPFTLRAYDEKKVRFAIKEIAEHQLVHDYPVLHEKEGELVAHFKYTALVMPTGPVRLTGLPVDVSKIKSDHTVTDDSLKSLLSQSASAAKKKKKPAAKKKDGAAPDLVSAKASMDTSA